MRTIVLSVCYLLANAAAFGADVRHNLYSPESTLLAETEQEYIWFAERPVAQFDGAAQSIRYTFSDHLATPILQTATDTAVRWRAEYEPYGEIHALRTGGELRQPLRMPGQEADAASGDRVYNIQRWYRPSWSLYTQPDPMGEDGTTHPYLYVGGHPLIAVDPLGLYESRGATHGQKQAIDEAMRVMREEMAKARNKKACDRCVQYFSKLLADVEAWAMPGGPPYIVPQSRPRGIPITVGGYSQTKAPWEYIFIFDDRLGARALKPCELASDILHEMGHLARNDSTDNEPPLFFNACRIGCLNPGRGR